MKNAIAHPHPHPHSYSLTLSFTRVDSPLSILALSYKHQCVFHSTALTCLSGSVKSPLVLDWKWSHSLSLQCHMESRRLTAMSDLVVNQATTYCNNTQTIGPWLHCIVNKQTPLNPPPELLPLTNTDFSEEGSCGAFIYLLRLSHSKRRSPHVFFFPLVLPLWAFPIIINI